MQRITINLLPEEFRIEELKRTKFYKVQSIGVGIIMLFIFLATLIVALRLLQSQALSQVQAKLTDQEQKVTDLKTTQASVLLLKDRLIAINQYLGIPSKQVQTYQLINKLLPASVNVASISIDKSGNILILAASPNAASIDDLIEKLTTSEEAKSLISNVFIEGLNQGKDGIFRINLKITTKGN